MNTTSRIYSPTNGYKYLFIDLIVLFLLIPFASIHRSLSLIVSFCFLVTLLLGLNTLAFPKRVLFLFRFFATLGFISDIIIFPDSQYLDEVIRNIKLFLKELYDSNYKRRKLLSDGSTWKK